jgi:PIN domain nuclease of toxin-antitoxin system
LSAGGGYSCVLDASALLALLQGQPGSEVVEPLLETAVVSSVNWSEVAQKSLAQGVEVAGLREDLTALGLTLASFTARDAEDAASLRESTKNLGLSLADRACLALAGRLETEALTTDWAWSGVASVSVRIIR